MTIGVANNDITINLLPNELLRYQMSQLEFYGYSFIDNQFLLKSNCIENDLLKVINYFGQEGIDYELSINAEEIFSNVLKQRAERENQFRIAKELKNGIVDSESYSLFRDFLELLPRRLKSHQIKAAFHLYSIKNGANFSVPGSGKTSVVISVYEKLRLEGKCNMIFVVGPPSCFQPWQNEFFETVGRHPDTVLLSGGNKELRKGEYYKASNSISELYLSTFHTVLNDVEDILNFLGQKKIHCFFVIDEAHYMKQIGGSWAETLLRIASITEFRCILTGTPIPKSYTDIFNLFDFLWDKEYPLTENDKIVIQQYEKKGKNNEVKNILDKKIGPLFYRVRKQDLGLKPAIFHPPLVIGMKPYEKRIYELIKAKIHQLSRNDFIENRVALENLWRGRMMRLRQVVSYPKLLLKSIDKYGEILIEENSELVNIIRNYDNLEVTGKLEVLTEKVRELLLQKQKILIWSNFVDTIKLLKSHFIKHKWRCEVVYGATPVKKKNSIKFTEIMTRNEIRDIFVDENSGMDILIANPAAFSESVSLHKTCFYAIYYDLSYNCAQYLQSLDRIHRVGGSEKKTANYYFLQYEDSIDQDIKLNLELKAKKMYSIVEQDYEIYNLDMFDEEQNDDVEAYKRLFHHEKHTK